MRRAESRQLLEAWLQAVMHRRWYGILKRLVEEETQAALDDHPLLLDVAAKKAAKERAAQHKAQLGERGSSCTTCEAPLHRTWGDRAGPAPGLLQAAGCLLRSRPRLLALCRRSLGSLGVPCGRRRRCRERR